MTIHLCRQKTNLEKSEKGRPHVRIGFQNLTQDVEWRHCGHHIHPEESKANGGGFAPVHFIFSHTLKGLSYEIDFENVDEN
jgi:hypothetical protein